jgi:O-antigen/teichoic acid export membrane protein
LSIVQKILGNTFAQILGKLATAVIALLTVNILSRYFSASDFGDYGTIYEYLAIFGAIADMGIYTLVLREMSKPQNDKSELYGLGFALRVVVTAISMLLAVGIIFFIPAYEGTKIPLGVIIAAIGTFFILMSGTVSVVLQYALKMKFYSYSLIAGKLFTFIGVVLVTQFWFPEANDTAFFWILFLGLLGTLVILAGTFFFSQKEIPLNPKFEKQKLLQLFKESLPFGIAMVLSTLYFRVGFLLLGILLPRSENGVCEVEFCGDLESAKYLVSLRMMEVLMYFPLFFMNSFLPFMTQKIEEKSEKTPRILGMGFLFLFALGLPMAVGGFFLATPLSGTLASPTLLAQNISGIFVAGSDSAFEMLSIALIFAFLNIFYSFLLIALGKQTLLMKINFLALACNVTANILLIPHFGILGAAYSTLISEIFLIALFIFFLMKYVRILYPVVFLFKIFLACVLLGIFLFFYAPALLNEFGRLGGLGVLMIISGILFFGTLFVSRFFTPELKSFLQKS